MRRTGSEDPIGASRNFYKKFLLAPMGFLASAGLTLRSAQTFLNKFLTISGSVKPFFKTIVGTPIVFCQLESYLLLLGEK